VIENFSCSGLAAWNILPHKFRTVPVSKLLTPVKLTPVYTVTFAIHWNCDYIVDHCSAL